jgi:signal transduction histidine kinase
MLRAVVTLIVLLLVCAYAALILSWNAALQPPITVLQVGASQYQQTMPIGLLLMGGVLVGAVAMALALWSPWNALKHAEAQQRELVQRAKSKLKAQSDKLKELTREAESAAPTSAPSPEEDLPPEAKAAAAEAEPTEAVPADTGAAEEEAEVI